MRLLTLLMAVALATARNYPPGPNERVDARKVVIDNQGFVWVSGKLGTFRFDGARYLPAAKLGFDALSADAHIAVTSDGTVWASSGTQLWRLEGDRFLHQPSRGIHAPVEAAGPFLWVNQSPLGVFYRDNGELRWAEGPVVSTGLRLHGESDGRIWFGGRFEPGKPSTVRWMRFAGGRFEEGEQTIHFETLLSHEVAPAGEAGLFTSNKTETNRFIRKDGAHDYFHASRHIPSSPVGSRRLSSRNGEVWYEACGQWLSSNGRSVPATGAYEVAADDSGGVWAAMGEKGLTYFPREDIQVFSLDDFPDAPVVAMSRFGNRLFVARQDMTAVITRVAGQRFCNGAERTGDKMQLWGKTGAEAPITGLVAEPDGSSVWVLGKNFGVSKMTIDGRNVAEVLLRPGSRDASDTREAAFTPDGRLWLASKSNLLEVRRAASMTYSPVFPDGRYVASFAVTKSGETIAVGDGALFRYSSGDWKEEGLPSCLLSPKLRTAAIDSNDSIWYAYRDRVGFTHAQRSGTDWACGHFDAMNGFPGDTQFLTWDRAGRLWRGSSTGLFIRGATGSWSKLRVPDGEMHQLFHEDVDGAVFLSIGKQLLRLPPGFATEHPPSPPAISYFETNSGISLRPEQLAFEFGGNSLLHFAATAERALGGSPGIEFRFDSGAWQPIGSHTLTLHSAPRSASRLEFRYMGAAQSAAIPLTVSVPFVRSYWFYALIAAGLAVFGRVAFDWFGRWQYQRQKRVFLAKAGLLDNKENLAGGTLLHGRYRVERIIADGGFSHVYAARDESNGDAVVVKRIRRTSAPPDHVKRRFAQEVAAVSMVRHAGIVPIVDAWVEADGVPNLVMPFVNGPTLRRRLRERRFEKAEGIALLRQLASVLGAAHARGVVHSDFKPENVLLASGGPMVIDFGSSALQMASGLNEYSRQTASLQYMAPEQLLGRYSKATDVYAFALVAMEVLTGGRYIDIDVPMNDDWEPEFLRAAVAELGISTAQAEVFVDALRFDPERRAHDVEAWMERLDAASV